MTINFSFVYSSFSLVAFDFQPPLIHFSLPRAGCSRTSMSRAGSRSQLSVPSLATEACQRVNNAFAFQLHDLLHRHLAILLAVLRSMSNVLI
jgi:hypothetical protein